LALATVLSILGSGSGVGQEKKPPPHAASQPVPRLLADDVVGAWAEAGTHVGWMRRARLRTSGTLAFTTKKETPGDIPAFRLARWRSGGVPKLPPPGVPFGLYLKGLQVTDAGLKELAGLKNLQSLDLGNTQVTDVGVKELGALKNLELLYLGRTQVTDVGLKGLLELENLESLNLVGTPVTDEGLRNVGALQNLQSLHLSFCKRVTDAGVKELAGLKSLKTLFLPSCKQVTNVGLKELAGLRNLQSVYLSGTQATDAGIAELQKALPACRISR
jgi:Leucine-rich repeat (LRR) protein